MKKIEIDKEKFYDLYINQDLTLKQCAEILGGSSMVYSRFANENGIHKDKEKIVAKQRATYAEQHNGAVFGWSEESRSKRAATNLKKYGYENPLSNKEVQQRGRDTYFERTGYHNPGSNPDAIAKGHATKMQRYGMISPSCSEAFVLEKHPNLTQETLDILNNKDNFIKFIKDNEYKITSDIAKALNCSNTTIVHRLHKYDLWDMIDPYISRGEHELADFLDELGIVHKKDKSIINPFEIDVYCPDYQIGIEYNGTYWHSSAKTARQYHQKKSKLVQEKGARLIHIYEYEWESPIKQKIIKSMLKIAFGKAENRIYARQCEIREISNKEAKPFNEANHLQGHRNAQITYGLYYNNELVQLMSFSYDKKKGWWEIIRGCPGSNNVVVGGVSRLFNHFIKEKNPDKIFSYCDFNKFDGKGYEAIGMKFIGYTGPDMKWLMSNGDVINRQPGKHKELKDEAIAQIWGAGSKKYLWTKDDIKKADQE